MTRSDDSSASCPSVGGICIADVYPGAGNSELPDGKARDAYQANTGGSTVNLRDPDGFFVQISSKDGR
jgi:hypothetical protein